MKTVKSSLMHFCIWAQILLLLTNCVCLSPALAVSSNDLSFSDLTKLSSMETVIYGNSYKNMPSEKRIGSLERVLLGKVQKGPLPARLAVLVSAVNGENKSTKNLLSPPLAPELDRSDTLTKTATPPLAPQTANEISHADTEMPPTAQEDRIKVMLQQAMQLYSQGQANQAETIFKNVLSLDSRNSDANFNLGAIAESRSDWQNALHYYQAAQSSQPNDKDIQTAVQSMQAKVQSQQSISNVSRQNQQGQNPPGNLSPQQLGALRQKVNQAASAYQNGNYDAAINILHDVANQAPGQADVQYALGEAYRAKGENAQARLALAQATALAPNNQEYKNALSDLDQQMTGHTANNSTDTFGNNNPYGSGNLASNQNGPMGQITPFTPDASGDNGQSNWQSTAPSSRFYSGGNNYFGPSYSPSYMPGYAYSGYSPYGVRNMGGMGMGTAAMAGLAGMALGSMFGLMMSRHRY